VDLNGVVDEVLELLRLVALLVLAFLLLIIRGRGGGVAPLARAFTLE